MPPPPLQRGEPGRFKLGPFFGLGVLFFGSGCMFFVGFLWAFWLPPDVSG